MKIAILSINIGQYIEYWDDFYKSAKKNFLSEYDRQFFVFTNHNQIRYQDESDVTVIYQKDLGWPGNTLMRYEMFCGIENLLGEYDYVFFANANLFFYRPIGTEVLPQGRERFVFVRRPEPYIRKEKYPPYEDNPQSLAYVKPGESRLMVRGGFNGGTTEAFLEMSRTLRDRINDDKERGIIAKWHDESHITRYAIGRTDVKTLFPGYLYPQGWVMPYEKKILIRPKDNDAIRFGTARSKRYKIMHQLFLFVRNTIYSLLIIFHILKFEREDIVNPSNLLNK